jgi:hypothetical protein
VFGGVQRCDSREIDVRRDLGEILIQVFGRQSWANVSIFQLDGFAAFEMQYQRMKKLRSGTKLHPINALLIRSNLVQRNNFGAMYMASSPYFIRNISNLKYVRMRPSVGNECAYTR